MAAGPHLLEDLERDLLERSFLAEDGDAYRDGVRDTLDALKPLVEDAPGATAPQVA